MPSQCTPSPEPCVLSSALALEALPAITTCPLLCPLPRERVREWADDTARRPEPGAAGAAVRRPCSSLPLGLSAPHAGTGAGSVTSGPVGVRKPRARKRLRLPLPGRPRPGPGRSAIPGASSGRRWSHGAPWWPSCLNTRGRRRRCPPLPQGENTAQQFAGAPEHRAGRPSASPSPVRLLPARCPVYYFSAGNINLPARRRFASAPRFP